LVVDFTLLSHIWFGSRADLLLRAKHLFVAAIVAGVVGGTGLGPKDFSFGASNGLL
jgi:hypothetical protein